MAADRRGSDALARKISLRVLHENKDADTLLREMQGAQVLQGGVPVDWQNNQQSAFQSVAPIVGPDGYDMASYSRPPTRVCGNCKKFNVASGRKAMIEQRFLEVLVRDHRWQMKHLGVDFEQMGMCDESAGTRITCAISNAEKCDAYRAR